MSGEIKKKVVAAVLLQLVLSLVLQCHCDTLKSKRNRLSRIPPETCYLVTIDATSSYHPENKQPKDADLESTTKLLSTPYDPPFFSCKHAKVELKGTNFTSWPHLNVSKLLLTFLVDSKDKKQKITAYYCAENTVHRAVDQYTQLKKLLEFREGKTAELNFTIGHVSCCKQEDFGYDPCCKKNFTLENDTCVMNEKKSNSSDDNDDGINMTDEGSKTQKSAMISLSIIIIITIGCVIAAVAVILASVFMWRRRHPETGDYNIGDIVNLPLDIQRNNSEFPCTSTIGVGTDNRDGYMKMCKCCGTNQAESESVSRASSVTTNQGSKRPMSRSELTFEFDKHIPLTAIRFTGTIIGRGQFGQVELADVEIKGQKMKCAVKMIRGRGTDKDERELFEELQMLAQIPAHPNVVNLLGGCMEAESPLYVIVEYYAKGSLLNYLKENRNNQRYVNLTDPKLDFRWKINRAIEICEGMIFLAHKQIIHRDLAARNILLDGNEVAKISDFGMAKDVYLRGLYVKETAGFLPVRWMAIEAIESSIYTIKSDIWSFGILLWELYMDGRSPYPGIHDGSKLLGYLEKGHRMSQPEQCPDDFYQLMNRCWLKKPDDRPSFTQALRELELLNEAESRKGSASSLKSAKSNEVPTFEEEEEKVRYQTPKHNMNSLGIVNHGRSSVGDDSKLGSMSETEEETKF